MSVKFVPENLVLKLTNKEIKNILGHLQENPKVNHFTIMKLKKQIKNKEEK